MKNLTWQNPEQLFVAQELINKVKSKCCGIKDIKISNMKNLKKYIIIAILASVVIYLSGCASLTYNPHSQTEKVKVTLKNK